MTTWKALGSGLAGALALTAVHEIVRRQSPQAPRMDVLGMRAIARSLEAVGQEPPAGERLHQLALVGDVVSNSLYYSLVGLGKDRHTLRRGAILGLIAGLGAALLPPVLGLGNQPHRKTPWTQVLTVLWYLAGGLVAAAVAQAVEED